MSLKSAVYGFAVGDALGVPYEFKRRGTFKCEGMTGFGTWMQPAGTWSDDTSMILATCDSIGKNDGKIVVEDITERFVRWWSDACYSCNGEVFDIGGTTAEALRLYTTTGNAFDCGLSGEQNNGNGGLMRILPLAFVKYFKTSHVHDVCKITHNTELSKIACSVYCDALRTLKSHGRISVLDLDFYSDLPRFERLAYIHELPESEIKSTGYVVDTLEAALWCFMTTDNYRECVLKAVNLGGDTDTIAALAGGLAGVKYGINGIPKEWLEQLRNKEMIEGCLFASE